MKTSIHFTIYFLITLISNNLFSQGTGWEIVLEVPSYQQTLYEVQFVNNSTGFAGGGESKLYKTTNAGLNWVIFDHYNINNRDDYNSIYFLNAQTGLIGGDYGRLYKTIDGGVSLDTIYPGGGDHFHSIFFPSRDTGYMATKYGGLLKTINGGSNWIIQQQPNTTGYRFEGLFCVNNEVVFASGNKFNTPYFQICRTTNGGINWEGIKIDSADWIYNVFFTNLNTGFVVGERTKTISPNIQYYEGLVFKTTDGGDNWILKLADSSSIYRSIQFINTNTGFVVGTSNSSFAKTTDAGESWSVFESYLFGGLWSVYFIDANTGIAAGEYRVIRTTNGGEPIGIKPISSGIPDNFSLSQNYPNPFNPETRINFSVTSVGERHAFHTTLIVFDIHGKEVQTLVNENILPGTYEVNFNGCNLPSGVYYYRLEAGDYKETKKMVLLK